MPFSKYVCIRYIDYPKSVVAPLRKLHPAIELMDPMKSMNRLNEALLSSFPNTRPNIVIFPHPLTVMTCMPGAIFSPTITILADSNVSLGYFLIHILHLALCFSFFMRSLII